jgi:capsular polysaccharide biosynthesis protein
MNEDPQNIAEIQKLEYYEDEIELIDILRVIWKWKYLILIGTALCGSLAGIISFSMPKIYKIDMTLQPGVVSIDQKGHQVYIDSVQNIKTIIETNALKNKILKYLQKTNKIKPSEPFNIEVSIPNKSDVINITYETKRVDFGIDMLRAVYESLRGEYDGLVKYYQNNYDIEIQSIKAEIAVLEAELTSSKQRVKKEQERIKELESVIIEMAKNNIILIHEKKEAMKNKTSRDKSLLAVLYNNTIQQNQSLSNQYRNDIKESLYRIEEEKEKNNDGRFKQDKLSADIRALEFKKGAVQNIKIFQTPIAEKHPIKPKTKLNIILALVAGLSLMLFLAFFLEYLSRYKRSQNIDKSIV